MTHPVFLKVSSCSSNSDSVVHDVKAVLIAKLQKCQQEIQEAEDLNREIAKLAAKMQNLAKSEKFRDEESLNALRRNRESLELKLQRVEVVVGVLDRTHN